MTDPDFFITIYHNAACGTSRNVVAMVEAAGYTPTIVEYLHEGWALPLLEQLLAASQLGAGELLREKGTPARELDLLEAGVSGDEILRQMMMHPILVNRPIVVTPRGTRLCRPSEVVLTLLDRQPESFTKEDGEVVQLS